MMPPEPQWNRVDRWELRCRFNHAKLQQRVSTGELEFRITKRNPIIRRENDPDPLPSNYKFTCEWYYKNLASGLKVADGHVYELDDKSVTDLDPKHLRVDGKKYALYGGTGRFYDIRRDATVLFRRHSLPYRIYVRFRRFTCDLWGW